MTIKCRKKSDRILYEKMVPSGHFPDFFSREVFMGTEKEFAVIGQVDKLFESTHLEEKSYCFFSNLLKILGIDTLSLNSQEARGVYLFFQSRKAFKEENIPPKDILDLLEILNIRARVETNYFSSAMPLKSQRLHFTVGDLNGPKSVFRIFVDLKAYEKEISKFKNVAKIIFPKIVFVFVKETEHVSL